MADILIKGMKMPKSCYTCQFVDNYEGSFCLATNDEHHIDHMTAIRRRPKWCPLIEVKPHGRVIDVDAFIESEKGRVVSLREADNISIRMLYERIVNAPTVLEASE